MASRLPQESHELVVGEVADTPPQDDAVVRGLPEVRLHRVLVDQFYLYYSLPELFQMFDSMRALVEAVDSREEVLQQVF